MKNKIWIVAQREYATRVKKRSFIILTILMPFLMAAILIIATSSMPQMSICVIPTSPMPMILPVIN